MRHSQHFKALNPDMKHKMLARKMDRRAAAALEFINNFALALVFVLCFFGLIHLLEG